MFKKSLSLVLIGALAFTLAAVPSVTARSKEEQAAQFAAKVQAGIARLGVGRDTRVEVKLRDKTKLKGYLSEVTADTFAVTDLKTGATTTVAYPEITQVKGNNLSTGAIIAISVAAAVGVTLLVIWLLIAASD